MRKVSGAEGEVLFIHSFPHSFIYHLDMVIDFFCCLFCFPSFFFFLGEKEAERQGKLIL